jgi:hypothetical protein
MNRSEQLAGIRLKLARAWQQIDALKPDIKAFIATDPYLPRVNFNPQTHELRVSVEVQCAPDPMWGVRIGEIVHNFRSALDHLVWELVILSTRHAPARGSKNQFPIFETAAGFDGRGVSQFLRNVRTDAVDLIRSEQPFATGEGERSPLWHLKELSDIDKHRTLHVTGAMVETFNFMFPPLKHDAVVHREPPRGPGPIQQDSILGRAYFPGVSSWPFADDKVQCELRVDVAFDHGIPAPGTWLVFATLADAGNRTERVLRRVAEEIFKIGF